MSIKSWTKIKASRREF